MDTSERNGMTWESSKENEHSIVISYQFIQSKRIFQKWSITANSQPAKSHQVPLHNRYACDTWFKPFLFHYKTQDATKSLFSIKKLLAKTRFFVAVDKNHRRAKKYPSIKSASCGLHPYPVLATRSLGLHRFHIIVPSPTVSATQQSVRRGVHISLMVADSLGLTVRASFHPSLVR